MDTQYVVTILLRAREFISNAFNRAAGSVDKLRQSEEQLNKVGDEHTRVSKRQGDALDQLTEAHVREKVATDSSREALEKRLSQSRAAEASYRQEAVQLEDLSRSRIRETGAVDDVSRSLDRQARERSKLAREQERVSRVIEEDIDSQRRWGRSIRNAGDDSHYADVQLNRLNSSLRGFAIAFVIKYAQALTSALVGLAGVLFSVASAAAVAGATLAGALVSGVGQALPLVGVLAAGLWRIVTVMKAVTLHNQQALTATHDQTAAQERQRNAAQQVTAAQERVAEAHRKVQEAEEGVTLAQDNLTEARREAIRELEDLIAAERRAQLQAEAANLAFEASQRSLRDAIRTGDVVGAAEASVDVGMAREGRQTARTDARRASIDATRGRAAGVDDSERVLTAERQLAEARKRVDDANRDVRKSERQLTEARHDAAVAMDKQTASADRLQAMLAQMSPAERRLYQSVLRLQNTFRERVRPITDILVNAFARGIDRGVKLLHDNRLMGAFRGLSKSMAQASDDIGRELMNSDWRRFFVFMTREASRNVPIVTRILLALGRTLRNIAEAAAPAFRMLLRMMEGYADRADRATRNTRKLEDFFKSGVKYVRSFIELGIAAIKLFAALAGAGGADEGKKSIDGITASLNRSTRWVNGHRSEVRKFFADARGAAGEVMRVIVAIAKEMIHAFRPGTVKAFADFLVQVVIPALGNTIEIMGLLTSIFHTFLSLPIVRDIAQYAATILLLTKAFMVLRGAVAAIVGLARAFLAFNPYVAIFIALATAVVMLDRKFHFLKPTLEFIERIWKRVFNALKKPISDLIDFIKKNWEGVAVVLAGPIGLAAVLIVKNFDRIKRAASAVVDFVIDAFRGGGGTLARVFRVFSAPARVAATIIGGALRLIVRILRGVVEVVTHLIRGDWGKAWKALTSMVSDAVRIVGRTIGRIAGIIWNALKDAIGLARKGIGTIARAIVGGIRAAVRGVGSVIGRLPGLISGAFEKVFSFMASVPGKLASFAKDGVKGIVGAFTGIGGAILESIVKGVGDVAGFGRRIINGIIGLLNKAIPNSLEVPGPVPNIDLPNNPIPELAVGGKVKAQMYMVGEETPGFPEYVFSTNPRDRARMLPLLLELLQVYGIRGFQEGGRRGAGGGATRGDTSGLDTPGVPSPEHVERLMKDINKIVDNRSDDLIKTWRRTWRRMFKILDDSGDDQRRNLRSSLRRMNTDTDTGFTAMQRTATRRSGRMVEGVQDSLRSLMRSVFTGMSYVGDATNQALKTFDVKPVDLNVPRPKGLGKASGGVIGKWGERGKDAVATWLGRGEVVLNWAQQQALNARLAGQDTVQSVVDRTRAFHAGGPQDALGFAQGGSVDVKGAGPGFVPFMLYLRKLFGSGIYVMSGLRPGSTTTSGNTSNHSWGGAVDITHTGIEGAGPGNPPGGPVGRKMDATHRWIGKYFRSMLLDFLWRTTVGGNHFNHIHAGIAREYSFSAERMRNFISKLPQGAGFGDMPKIKVEGTDGKLKDLAQAVINMARKGAQKFIDKKMESQSGFLKGFKGGGDSEANMRLGKRMAARYGWTGGEWSALRELWIRESGWNQFADNPTSDAYGIPQSLPGSKMAAAGPDWRTNPATQIAWGLDYIKTRPGYGSPSAALAFHNSHNWYGAGGEVPGPLGKAVDAVVHAGEWVLNTGHQERLAKMLGVTRDRAKEILGLVSRRGSFEDGGVVSAGASGYRSGGMRGVGGGYRLPWPRDLDEVFTTIADDLRNFRGDIREKGGKLSKKIRSTFGELTRDGGLLDQINTMLEGMQAAATAAIQRATFRVRRDGTVRRRTRMDPVRTARREESALLAQRQVMLQEQRLIARSERSAREALRRAQELGGKEGRKAEEAARAAINNLEARSKANMAAIAQNVQDVVEKHEQVQQALTERINSSSERHMNALDTQERIATALGRDLDPNRIAQRRLKILENQQERIASVLRQARATGNRELVDTLRTQLRDLRGQMAELTGQMFQNSIDAVNEVATRELAANDLVARMAEIGRTDFAGKQRAFESRGAILARQRAGLAGLLSQAEGAGNIDQVRLLTQSIGELDVSIAENSQAVKDNTNAALASRIEGVNTTFGFAQTINQAAAGFFQALGALTGATDQPTLLGLARNQTGALETQRAGLSGLLSDLLGYNPQEREGLLGMSGADLVNYILSITTGPALESILARLDDTQQGQFRDLTGALVSNAQALVDNTQSINELTGQVSPQAFTSSAWQMFRQAIYNGMGGLMPQYTPPQLHNGALVTRDGTFELAAGEAVLDPVTTSSLREPTVVHEGDTTITVEKGDHLSESQLATQWAWQRKRRSKGS